MKDFLDNKTGDDFYPEAFLANKLIEEAKNKIADIEEKIANLPKDRAFVYGLTPPGMRHNQPEIPSANQKRVYTSEIDKLKLDTEKKVISTLEKSKAEVRRKGYDNLDKFLNPDTKDKKPLKEKIQDEKDISKSQDVATEIVVGKEEQDRNNGSFQDKSNDGNEKKEKPEIPSISSMFNAKLGYTKLTKGTKEVIDKSEKQREKEIEKE